MVAAHLNIPNGFQNTTSLILRIFGRGRGSIRLVGHICMPRVRMQITFPLHFVLQDKDPSPLQRLLDDARKDEWVDYQCPE